ncbi:PAS domain-containing protein [Novosphingobium sp. YJ-S2-02]|uniref:PAS domain-containing protein n=1 Tax=Novosphingobium aureum TaxID=2792964 RepID=A0A931HBF6_9SPHN|nr:PAS domain-containing protein [Novosphingobium aureum]
MPEHVRQVLAGIVESRSEAIHVLNSFGEIEYLNRYARHLLGEHGVMAGKGTGWIALFPRSAQLEAENALLACLMGRDYRFICKSRDRQRESRYWDISVRRIENPLGTLENILVVIREVTDILDRPIGTAFDHHRAVHIGRA